jgi:hypothetical protein
VLVAAGVLVAWPSHGHYRIETRGIASYDLETRQIKVLHRGPGTTGSSYPRFGVGYGFVGVCWDNVLVARDGDQSYHWLDRTTGVLTRSPLPADAAARGLDPKRMFILDGRGTIAMWATPRSSPTGQAVLSTGGLRLRRSSGAFEHVGLVLEVYPTGDGRLFYTSPLVPRYGGTRGHYVLYEVETGARDLLSLQDGVDMVAKLTLWDRSNDLAADWCAGARRDVQLRIPGSGDGLRIPHDRLELNRLGPGGWQTETLALGVEDMKNALRR